MRGLISVAEAISQLLAVSAAWIAPSSRAGNLLIQLPPIPTTVPWTTCTRRRSCHCLHTVTAHYEPNHGGPPRRPHGSCPSSTTSTNFSQSLTARTHRPTTTHIAELGTVLSELLTMGVVLVWHKASTLQDYARNSREQRRCRACPP